jgi:hypothetical protein
MSTATKVRTGAAATILLGFSALHAYSAWKGFEGVPAVVFSLGNLVGAVALWRGRFWARWFGLGIGMVGLLNCLTIGGVLSGSQPIIAAQGAAFGLLSLLLVGRQMAEAFEGRADWPLDSWRMRLVSWAALLNIGAVAMLIRGLGNPWSPGCIQSASIAGIVLGIVGIVLVWTKRTAGLFLLALSAVNGLLLASHAGQWAVEIWSWTFASMGHHVCGVTQQRMVHALISNATLATALIPAAAGALLALFALARPIVGFLRERD